MPFAGGLSAGPSPCRSSRSIRCNCRPSLRRTRNLGRCPQRSLPTPPCVQRPAQTKRGTNGHGCTYNNAANKNTTSMPVEHKVVLYTSISCGIQPWVSRRLHLLKIKKHKPHSEPRHIGQRRRSLDLAPTLRISTISMGTRSYIPITLSNLAWIQ